MEKIAEEELVVVRECQVGGGGDEGGDTEEMEGIEGEKTRHGEMQGVEAGDGEKL